MLGDAVPHEVHYPHNLQRIDWREEIKKLRDERVRLGAGRARGSDCNDGSILFSHKQHGGDIRIAGNGAVGLVRTARSVRKKTGKKKLKLRHGTKTSFTTGFQEERKNGYL